MEKKWEMCANCSHQKNETRFPVKTGASSQVLNNLLAHLNKMKAYVLAES